MDKPKAVAGQYKVVPWPTYSESTGAAWWRVYACRPAITGTSRHVWTELSISSTTGRFARTAELRRWLTHFPADLSRLLDNLERDLGFTV